MATLLETINQYRSAMAEFNKHELQTNEECDAYADVTFVPPMTELIAWEGAATSHEEAIAALELVKSETHNFRGSLVVPPLLDAVYAYFNGPVDSKLNDLIEAHKVAYVAFCKSCTAVDRIEIGRDPTEAENAAHKEADEAEEAAYDAVLEYPAANRATAVAKLEYVTHPHRLDDVTTSHYFDRLESLLWSFVGGKPDREIEGRAGQ